MSELHFINGKWNCETVPVQWDDRMRDVPRVIAEEAYKEYSAQHGSSQTFKRLHERGGFGVGELLMLLCDRIKRVAPSGEQGGAGEKTPMTLNERR